MKKVGNFRQNPFWQSKVCLRLFAVAVAVTLIFTFCIPLGAIAPETGYTTLNTTVYSALDMLNGTGKNNSTTLSVSNDASTWKFAVGSVIESPFGLVSDSAFAAPAVIQTQNGVKLTWNAPNADSVYSVVYITDGADYNKEINCSVNEAFLDDLTIGSSYSIQVKQGNSASAVLTYKHAMISANKILRSDLRETGEFNMTSHYQRFFIDLGTAAQAVTENGALIFKINTEMIPERAIIFDTATNKADSTDYPEAFSSNDAWVGISSALETVTVTGEDETIFYQSNSVAVDNTGTNNLYAIEENAGLVYSDAPLNNTNGVTYGRYKYVFKNFYEGYIIIPFDNYSAETLTTIQNEGHLALVNQGYHYYYNIYNNNGNKAVDELKATHTTNDLTAFNTDEGEFGGIFGAKNSITNANGVFNRVFDRQFTLSDVAVIPDYNAFVSGNIGETSLDISSETHTENTAYLAGQKPVAVNGEYIMEVNSDIVASKYSIYPNRNKQSAAIKYTAATGEKMMLGFTAPQAGTYEIASKIEAVLSDNVYFDVVKKNATGKKAIIQKEAKYTADTDKLCDILVKLEAGETVYIEAWSDTDGAVINIGNPQVVKHNTITEDGTYSFRAIDYFENGLDNGQKYDSTGYTFKNSPTAWQAGYFENPITTETAEDGTVTVTDYDGLGLNTLEVDDTAAAVLYALNPYYITRSGNHYLPEIRNSGSTILTSEVGGYVGVMSPRKIEGTAKNNSVNSENNVLYTTFGYRDLTNDANSPSYVLYNKKAMNIGVYLQYTALADGTATLKLTDDMADMGNNNVRSIVMVNDTVKYISKKTVAKNTSVELGTLKKGDTVTLCFATVSNAKTNTYIGNPEIVLNTSLSSVTFSEDVSDIIDITAALQNNGTQFNLPELSRFNSKFRGWNNGTENLVGLYTVNGDVHFTPVFAYYGDANGNNRVDAADLGLYVNHILGITQIAEENQDIADVNVDNAIDLLDIVRLKKFIATGTTVLGA